MLRVGLTGGIGSGKSTVARMLADLGAVIIDGDAIARELVTPGSPALAAIVARFGPGVLREDATLDRAGLAELVFPDPAALADLDAIMHPRIAARAAELVSAADRAPAIVHDMPLLVESGQADTFDVVLVVVAPVELRIARLAQRGIRAEDARARMSRQATDEQRAGVADMLIDNSGDELALAERVQDAWQRILVAGARDARP